MSQLIRKLSALIAIVFVFSGCSSGGGGDDPTANNTNAPAPVAPVVKDLAVTKIGIATTTAIPGQILPTSATVQNSGNVDAPQVKLSFLLSQDNIVDSADVAIGSIDVAALAVGAKIDMIVAATLPNNTAAGNYFVLADVVWADDTVANNNVKEQATKVIVVNSTAAGVGVIATSQATYALVPTATGLTSMPVENSSTPAGSVALHSSTPVRLDSCAFDSIANKTVCIGFSHRYVYFFDIQVNATTGNIDDISRQFCVTEEIIGNNYGDDFSGGGCGQCAVTVDSGENRFVIARRDGYSVFDYTVKADGKCNLLVKHEIPITESFALDTKRKWLVAPEYDAGTTFIRTDGSTIITSRALRIVELKTGDVYTWDKKIDCAQLADPGVNCKLTQIDSASVDSSTGIVALTDETAEMVLLVDMQQAIFDSAKKTFFAPYTIVQMPLIAGPLPASAIDAGSHTLFMAAEHNVGFTALRLPATAGTAGAFPKPSEWLFNSAVTPKNDVCDATPGDGVADYAWKNMDEPHGISVFGSATDGSSYGLLISEQKDCVALVNLSKLINAPKIPGKNVIPLTGYDLEQNGIIRFVKIGG